MKSDEAIRQIDYLKELTEKSRLKAAESYPWFFIWGIFLIVGYVGSIFITTWIWFILWGVAAVISFVFSFIVRKKNKAKEKYNPPLLTKIAFQSLILFISGSIIFYILIRHEAWAEVNAFWPFHVGIIYMVAGIHYGRGVVLTGLWMAIVSMISIYIQQPYQNIWLAITAGGGMVFTGFFFRHQIMKSSKN